jgi:TRAP-type mannitol/chloroaromatic compound transport system permease small subunit
VTGHRWLQTLDRWTGRVTAALQWLALPLLVLLFLQWPLRDLVRAYSVQANDLAQIIFALYVAASLTAATRAGTHLAADSLARRYSKRTRHRLRKGIAAIGLLPWALFILIAGKPMMVASTLQLERFAETGSHGYFIIKLALCVIALTTLAQSVIEIFRPFSSDEP